MSASFSTVGMCQDVSSASAMSPPANTIVYILFLSLSSRACVYTGQQLCSMGSLKHLRPLSLSVSVVTAVSPALAPPQKRAEEAPQWSEGLILETVRVSCTQRGHRPLQRDPQMPLNLGSQRREGCSLQVSDPTAILISLHFLLS